MDLICHACGTRFRSALAEARHRHNFPVMCKHNKRFQKFVASNHYDALVDAVEKLAAIVEHSLPKFNWGASALDADAIRALNELPSSQRLAGIIRDAKSGQYRP